MTDELFTIFRSDLFCFLKTLYSGFYYSNLISVQKKCRTHLLGLQIHCACETNCMQTVLYVALKSTCFIYALAKKKNEYVSSHINGASCYLVLYPRVTKLRISRCFLQGYGLH